MHSDEYDDDLPEIKESWIGYVKSNKDTLIFAGKYVAIPTGLFLLTCVSNFLISKKVDSFEQP
jgi:hypothetical protein